PPAPHALSLHDALPIFPALYAAVVAVPASARLAFRTGLAGVPWLVAATPWVVVLLLTPLFLAPTWRTTFNEANVLLAAIFLLSADRKSTRLNSSHQIIS